MRTREPLAAREPLLDGGGPAAPQPRSRLRRSWGWIVLAFVVGGLLGWATTAAWWGNGGQPVADAGITAGGIVARAGSFLGDTATVTGQVNDVFVSAAGNGATARTGVVGGNGQAGGPQRNGRAGVLPGNGNANAPASGGGGGTAHAARLRGAFTIATPNGSLVILGAGGRTVRLLQHHPDLSQGVFAQVTGRVRRLDAATLRHLTIRGKATAAWYGQLRDQPAIAASRVALVPTQPAQSETLRSLSIRDLANAPTAFYGRRVTLSGDTKRLSSHAFVLSGGGHELLVLGTPPAGGHARVTGVAGQPKAATLVGLDRGLGLSDVLGKGGRSILDDYQAALVTGGR